MVHQQIDMCSDTTRPLAGSSKLSGHGEQGFHRLFRVRIALFCISFRLHYSQASQIREHPENIYLGLASSYPSGCALDSVRHGLPSTQGRA
jgi:hypothetical protein